MADQNWRTEVNALDYFGNQKKQASLDNRRPVIRKPSDLVGPGIAANAIRLTDFNDHLATYDGFFSADVGALNAPNSTDAFVGTVTSDETLGGVQTFSGLTTQANYQRVFNRNPSDEATIYWGDWEIVGTAGTGGGTFTETLPASIMDAKGDLIVGAGDNSPVREAVGDDGESVVADSSTSTGIRWDTRVRTIVPAPDSSITVDDTDPLNPVIGVLDNGQAEWKWGDRRTLSATGTQIVRLTYEPVPESLVVRWHPGGHAGLPILNEDFTLDGQFITIPDPGYFSIGDVLSFQYEYNPPNYPAPNPSFVGGVTATFATDKSIFALPAGTARGDVLVLVVRGDTGSGGGGEQVDSVSCSDPRMSVAHVATALNGSQTIISTTWVGIEDGSGLPVVVDVHTSTYGGSHADGVLGSFTGVNGYGDIAFNESSSATPEVSGIAAVATVWSHGTFVVFNVNHPDGYTHAAQRGLSYDPSEISWWYDPSASSSPAGAFAAEGCVVIALI